MKYFKVAILSAAVAGLAACGGDNDKKSSSNNISNAAIIENTRSNPWYSDAEAKIAATTQANLNRGAAKNVILFVGDGMGISTVTAARILAGQLKGQSGEENNLSFDLFPYTGLAKTYNVDAQTPDSAGTMTALISGVKTDVGVIGVNENIVRRYTG